GGGANRPVDQPSRTMISQASANVTGRTNPRAGRSSRERRLTIDRSCAGAPSAAMVMPTRDMVRRPIATLRYCPPPARAARGGEGLGVGGTLLVRPQPRLALLRNARRPSSPQAGGREKGAVTFHRFPPARGEKEQIMRSRIGRRSNRPAFSS